jgi:hypothetical protein
VAKERDDTKVAITKDARRVTGYVHGEATGGITFSAKVFDEGSYYGIDKGRVSKLVIRKDGKIIVNYERGWDVKPQTPEINAAYERVMSALNALGKEAEIGNPKDLLAKIGENRRKVNHDSTFSVKITETLSMTVEVEASSREEAEQKVNDNWRNSEYILDADNFIGVTFEAAPVKREKTQGEELC